MWDTKGGAWTDLHAISRELWKVLAQGGIELEKTPPEMCEPQGLG